MRLNSILFTLALSALTTAPANSTVPTLINYQGLLTDSVGNPLDTTGNATFRLFEFSSHGIALWTETQSITAKDGLFNVILGSQTSIDPVLLSEPNRYLEVQFGTSTFAPRSQLVSVPFALRIATVDGASGGAIVGDLSISGKATIGPNHTNTGSNSFVAGEQNTSSGNQSTVGGGYQNTASNTRATVSGGFANMASGFYSSIGGGQNNSASQNYSAVYGGFSNDAEGSYCFVGGGQNNTAGSASSVVGGGSGNSASGANATIGGGIDNTASLSYAVVAGGHTNHASGTAAAVGGGQFDSAMGFYSGVFSGYSNLAGNGLEDTGAFVGGGYNNHVLSKNATIAGGRNNLANNSYATIGGGYFNTAGGENSTVSGGFNNATFNFYSSIGGGSANIANGVSARVCGGANNNAGAQSAFIGGGENNAAGGFLASILGGSDNIASGTYSVVAGGYFNRAAGNNSVAVGTVARTSHSGSIVISANTFTTFADSVYSSGNEQLVLRADGGYYLTNAGGAASIPAGRFLNTSTGGYLTTAGVWTSTSDENLKENFTDIDNRDVLEKIAELEITQWNYKVEGQDIKHVGPMGQDFYKKFGLGLDDKSISSIDASGVALAAIKALYQENQELKRRLEKLESKIK